MTNSSYLFFQQEVTLRLSPGLGGEKEARYL